jgi:hypothetical protein
MHQIITIHALSFYISITILTMNLEFKGSYIFASVLHASIVFFFKQTLVTHSCNFNAFVQFRHR